MELLEGTRGGLRPRDLAALIKPGIVASNTLTALAGAAFAARGALGAGPLTASGGVGRWGGAGNGSLPLALLAVAFGTAALVAGACTLNNWIDRDIDRSMERTRNRPTATGRVSAGQALGLGFLLTALGLATLAALGSTPALLGFAGSLIYLGAYSLIVKRRSTLSSLVGGLAGAIPPLIGWTAINPRLSWGAALLFLFLLVWQQAHVRALAMARASEYRAAAIPMPGQTETGQPREGLLGESQPRGRPGGRLEGRPLSGKPDRARVMVIIWIIILLPFPALLIAGNSGAWRLAFILGAMAATLAWAAIGVLTAKLESAAWGRLMFRLSLAVLVLTSAGLMALPQS
ncbi:MAG: protoheme IX farnesyltransferase [Rectinemataceae bacterium]